VSNHRVGGFEVGEGYRDQGQAYDWGKGGAVSAKEGGGAEKNRRAIGRKKDCYGGLTLAPSSRKPGCWGEKNTKYWGGGWPGRQGRMLDKAGGTRQVGREGHLQ